MILRAKKLITAGVTLAITAYLIYKVYSEASRIKVRPSQLLSPYTLLAVALGVAGYLTYTAVWHLYLRGIAEVSFKRTLLVNLSGTYLAFSFNAAVGTLVKVKFIGADYFKVLAASLIEAATEFMTGSAMLFVLTHNPKALLVALLLASTFLADRAIYRILRPVFERIKGEKAFEEFYTGWREAKSNPVRVFLALLLGSLLVLINAGTLISVARAFGVTLGLGEGIKAILYSSLLGGLLGTPGGLGSNELGVLMAIGNTGINVIVAFTFKFVNQYMFALLGAFAFYRFVLAEVGVDGGRSSGRAGEEDQAP